ncbi:MAG: DEAD/DEAH box helicase, partial [Pseudomonadota bacterium]|nr:DEAD/DEAH box helicase [Pseudomonadota bacterium]
ILEQKELEIFSKGFGFQETPDQTSVIAEVRNDLASEKPQDRLICGEVGFGKTEIALRAAFICAQNKKQVAVLAPTTILARQHYDLFCERFSDTNLKIEFISREKNINEKREIIDNLELGNTSIVIGTHALLSDQLVFSDLGLLIIDEEHKFGVRQKEKLRKYSKGINTISLSATPIPRSLNLALSKVRDISIISTPPPGRKAVETLVATYAKSLAKEAIEREFTRSGQIFYLVNNVSRLEEKLKELEKIVPDAKIKIAHGQMAPKELKSVMLDFLNKKIDILLCTTIIESGIDIANANTLIIEGVENFGLSQLHQIRGRVGRSNRQAYAYFFITSDVTLTKNASARLEALKFSDSLNSGFNLAMRDLEIRGAGEILGEKQSGLIDYVGLSLFSSMINRSIKLLEGIDDTHEEFEVKIGENGFIPETFIPQTEVRLEIYKKFSSVKNKENLNQLVKEIEDRFGALPEDIKILVNLTCIRIESSKLLITKIKGDNKKCTLSLSDNSNLVSKNSSVREISINYPEKIYSKSEFLLNKLKSFSN